MSAACSFAGIGSPIHQDNNGGRLKSTIDASAPPSPARTIDFSQQMPHQPFPARTKRLADRQFAFAHRAANLHHAGHVQAHDQQRYHHQGLPDGEEDCHFGVLETAGGVVRFHDAGSELVGRWKFPGQPRGNGRNSRARLRHTGAGQQAAVNAHKCLAAIETRALVTHKKWMLFEREKKDGIKKRNMAGKCFRCDAGDDVWRAIQSQRLADDVGVGGEVLPPEPVPQDHGGRGRVRLEESRPPHERHADRAEVVGRDEHCLCPPLRS